MSKRNKIAKPTRESEALREFRKANGLSIRKLAAMLDLSPTRVNQMELGRDDLSDEYLKNYLIALNLTSLDWNKYLDNREIKTWDLRGICIQLIETISNETLDEVYEYLISFQPRANVSTSNESKGVSQ